MFNAFYLSGHTGLGFQSTDLQPSEQTSKAKRLSFSQTSPYRTFRINRDKEVLFLEPAIYMRSVPKLFRSRVKMGAILTSSVFLSVYVETESRSINSQKKFANIQPSSSVNKGVFTWLSGTFLWVNILSVRNPEWVFLARRRMI